MARHLDPGGLHLKLIDDRVVLTGPAIRGVVEDSLSDPYIELLDCHEQKVQQHDLSAITIPMQNIYLLPNPSAEDTPIVAWNHANAWRRKHGLPGKFFSLTTGRQNQVVERGLSSLCKDDKVFDTMLQDIARLGPSALDHAFLLAEDAQTRERLAIKSIILFPDSFRGFLRLASLAQIDRPKLALLCYLQAINLDVNLVPRTRKAIRDCRFTASWGQCIEPREDQTILPEIRSCLFRPLAEHTRRVCSDVLWQYPVEKRQRVLYSDFILPRFFSWVYPGRIAGMSFPKNEPTIRVLDQMGFTDVLTLSEESPIEEQWFDFKNIRSLFIPVPNYRAPSLTEMDYIWSRVVAGGTWVIHCGGGVGRAGCVLACLIAMLGGDPQPDDDSSSAFEQHPRLDAQTAIKLLRQIRPTSLETDEQEQFVSSWISHRWKNSHMLEAVESSLEPMRVEYSARLPTFSLLKTSLLMLVGLPGSGKSWVASAIAKRRARGTTIVISQDESGSRRTCEDQISTQYKDGTLLILDRCNVDPADRKVWLSSCLQASHAVAINFSYTVETCRARINTRFNHPTIRAGRGNAALKQMHKLWRDARTEEGFAAVVTISSFSAAREVVRAISGPLSIQKFPRTRHLLNLGAATADDLIDSTFSPIRETNISVEEKIDGANMGFSLDYDGRIICQNRGHYVNTDDHAQFKALGNWLEQHTAEIYKLLFRDEPMPERYILYGEWCVARHSIAYTSLPDRFLAFDLYDRYTDIFVSRRVLADLLKSTTISQVPVILEGTELQESDVLELLSKKSHYTDSLMEGIYIRFEDQDRRYTTSRGKVVRGDFTGSIREHWTKRSIEYNDFAEVVYK